MEGVVRKEFVNVGEGEGSPAADRTELIEMFGLLWLIVLLRGGRAGS